MNREEIPEYLFSKASMISDFPESVVPVPQMTTKTAFFPGGRGLWNVPDSSMSPRVAILGQDFSTWEQHQEILHGNAEDIRTPTWKNLLSIAERAQLDLENCFFTNVFMGLRRNGLSTGVFPGFHDAKYMQQNSAFLQLQLEVLQPQLVVVLGSVAPIVLSKLAKGAEDWSSFDFKKIDHESRALLLDVQFGNVRTNLVALVHPSMRFANAKYRTFNGLKGDAAEISLLEDGMKLSGVPRSANGTAT